MSALLAPDGVGDCILTQHYDPDTGARPVTIDQADPRILVSHQVLYEMAIAGDTDEALTCPAILTCPDDDIIHCGGCRNPEHDWTGAILHIYGTNRTVVYRILGRADVRGGYRDPTWLAEWPD